MAPNPTISEIRIERERAVRQVYVVTCLSTVVVAPSYMNRPRGCFRSDSAPSDPDPM